MPTPLTLPAPDPQNETDANYLALDWVGIDRVQAPLLLEGWEGEQPCRSDCTLELSVSLASGPRGIHMSRLLEVLYAASEPLHLKDLGEILQQHQQRQGCESAYLSVAFHQYVERPAPVTGLPATQAIPTIWKALRRGERTEIGYQLRIPVTTLCPCSREISDYGAHSQRGWIQATLSWDDPQNVIAPRVIYQALHEQGSAPIYPLLKRADERHVTMRAYENPAFVEDLTRKATRALFAVPGVKRFALEARNEESIHTHDAIARIRHPRGVHLFER